MAIVHKATISPTKQELTTRWLDAQPWGGSGEIEMLGGYRFDDPAGEVGVESLLVRRGDVLLQLPLTYRAAPLADGELVTTMDHSVLGPRWIYLATSDPVGVECWVRSLLGEQEQAVTEVWEGDRLVERREPVVRVALEADGDRTAADVADASVVATPRGRLLVPHLLGAEPGGERWLVAAWDGGGPVVVAALRRA